MTEKRFDPYKIEIKRLKTLNQDLLEANAKIRIENKQLKQRNTNQYNQLDQLWQLIQAKDWETLTAMDNQMKEDEKRLRNEWKCYE